MTSKGGTAGESGTPEQSPMQNRSGRRRVALYARVSTRGDTQNPVTQLLPLRDWADREGVDPTEFVDWASAADMRGRAAWSLLLADCRSGKVKAVAVLRLDRAFRSSVELHTTLAEWQLLGIEFVSLRESFDTATPAGRLMLGMIGVLAEFERELIRDRIRDGMQRAKAEGKKIGRPRVRLSPKRVREAVARRAGNIHRAASDLGVSEATVYRRLRR